MENRKVLIIAEAGVNHNGDIILAKKLVDLAAEAGADIVKFQTFKASNLVTKEATMANYQVKNTDKQETQFEMLKRLELSEESFIELQVYCRSRGIAFLSTGFDLDSLEFLKTLKMGLWKIPSGEITNRPYLEFMGRQNDPVILSTGMSFLHEVEEALNVLLAFGLSKEKITILHCSTDYPTPFCDVHLNAMLTIKKEFGINIGYSDHTEGIEVALAAVAMGATVIEKHFTLDKNMPGPDHKASLNPGEFVTMVKSIRNIENAFGLFEKRPSTEELKNRLVARKSLVALRGIRAGEQFSFSNLTMKRPGSGISPMKITEVVTRVAKRDFAKDELIEL